MRAPRFCLSHHVVSEPQIPARRASLPDQAFCLALYHVCQYINGMAGKAVDQRDDPNDPYSPENLSWNWQRQPQFRPYSGRWMRGPRVPPPPGPPSKPSKAEHEQETRAEARAVRLHSASLSNAGVIIMGVVLAAVVVILVLVLVTRH